MRSFRNGVNGAVNCPENSLEKPFFSHSIGSSSANKILLPYDPPIRNKGTNVDAICKQVYLFVKRFSF